MPDCGTPNSRNYPPSGEDMHTDARRASAMTRKAHSDERQRTLADELSLPAAVRPKTRVQAPLSQRANQRVILPVIFQHSESLPKNPPGVSPLPGTILSLILNHQYSFVWVVSRHAVARFCGGTIDDSCGADFLFISGWPLISAFVHAPPFALSADTAMHATQVAQTLLSSDCSRARSCRSGVHGDFLVSCLWAAPPFWRRAAAWRS